MSGLTPDEIVAMNARLTSKAPDPAGLGLSLGRLLSGFVIPASILGDRAGLSTADEVRQADEQMWGRRPRHRESP